MFFAVVLYESRFRFICIFNVAHTQARYVIALQRTSIKTLVPPERTSSDFYIHYCCVWETEEGGLASAD